MAVALRGGAMGDVRAGGGGGFPLFGILESQGCTQVAWALFRGWVSTLVA